MTETIRVAVAQSWVETDIAANSAHIRELLDEAAGLDASLVLFPEGALSGYAKTQIKDWNATDWTLLATELAAIRATANKLGITAVVGTAQPLPSKRPHNSLCALPADLRYDKRPLSYSEVTGWYTPGFEPITLDQAGFRFGMTICIEVQFPELFAQYEELGVDCVLHATYGIGAVGDIILQAHAATNCLWIAVATCANVAVPASGIIGPDGQWLARCAPGTGIAVATLDRFDSRLDIALNKARPWRRLARQGQIYRDAR